MRKLIIITSVLLSSSLFGYDGYYAPYEGTKCITQGWNGGYSHGITDGELYTAGKELAYALDISGSFNVISVKDGEIVDTGWHSGFGNYIVIEHDDGLYSQYTHLKTIKIDSGKVKRGQSIGISGNTGTYSGGNHLHLQLYTTKYLGSSMANSRKVDFQGFNISSVDKLNSLVCGIDQMKTSRNKIYDGTNDINQNIEGIFDGAGSIIDPSSNGDGLNKDIAVMHSHTPDNSTVVFQWRSDNKSGSCKYLDIFNYYGKDLGDVTVTTRGWNSAFPNTQNQEIFEVRLDKEPFSIKEDSTDSGYTLISITSKKPLTTENNWIRAKCSNDSFKTKNRKYLLQNDSSTDDNKLVSVTHDYWWSGNGSIISFNDKNDAIAREQYGVDHDSAISFSTHNSFTAFQWQTNNKCQKLKIGVQKNWRISDEVVSIEEVKIKPWSSKDWDSQTLCNGKLPCIITSPKISNDGHSIDSASYYIIKIKSKAGSIPKNDYNKRYIKAECVN